MPWTARLSTSAGERLGGGDAPTTRNAVTAKPADVTEVVLEGAGPIGRSVGISEAHMLRDLESLLTGPRSGQPLRR